MIISKNGSNNKKLERLTKQIYIDILRKGQPVWLKVFGSSMYPFLQGEDFVHVEGVKTQDIKIGDILIVDNFDKNDAWFFAHRVVKIEKENDEVVFITKGDSNSEGLDEPFNSSSIVGRVFKIEHKDKVMDLRKIFWKKANPFIARMSLRHGRKLRAFAGVIDFAANWRRMHLRLISFALRGDLLKYNADGVILWCVRNLKDRRARASINKLLRMGVSWETLLHICMAQKISVAVYNMLKDYSDAMVPAGVKAQLNKQIFFINQRISGQYRTTIDFIKELNNKGYGLIFFGGPVYSEILYNDIFLRGFEGGIHVFSEKNNYSLIKKEITACGYFLKKQSNNGKVKFDIFHKDNSFAIIFWHKLPGLVRRFDDSSCMSANPEEQVLLASSMFVYSSYFSGLRYLADINTIVLKSGQLFDWEKLTLLAQESKASAAVYTACSLSKKLLKTNSISTGFLKQVRPVFFKRFFLFCFANRKTLLREKSFFRFFSVRIFSFFIIRL